MLAALGQAGAGARTASGGARGEHLAAAGALCKVLSLTAEWEGEDSGKSAALAARSADRAAVAAVLAAAVAPLGGGGGGAAPTSGGRGVANPELVVRALDVIGKHAELVIVGDEDSSIMDEIIDAVAAAGPEAAAGAAAAALRLLSAPPKRADVFSMLAAISVLAGNEGGRRTLCELGAVSALRRALESRCDSEVVCAIEVGGRGSWHALPSTHAKETRMH